MPYSLVHLFLVISAAEYGQTLNKGKYIYKLILRKPVPATYSSSEMIHGDFVKARNHFMVKLEIAPKNKRGRYILTPSCHFSHERLPFCHGSEVFGSVL